MGATFPVKKIKQNGKGTGAIQVRKLACFKKKNAKKNQKKGRLKKEKGPEGRRGPEGIGGLKSPNARWEGRPVKRKHLGGKWDAMKSGG